MRALVGLLAAFLCLSVSSARAAPPEGGPVEIPLREVWALEMPGTRDIADLEPGRVHGKAKEQYGPLTQDIVNALSASKRLPIRLPRSEPTLFQETDPPGEPVAWKQRDPGSAFVVSGGDMQALRAAHAVLMEKDKRAESVSGDSTLIFYALSGGVFVHLDRVERTGNNVTINYHFATHSTMQVTAHFALIPMGNLEPGTYHVKLNRLPTRFNPTQGAVPGTFDEERAVRDLVCKPFDFEVK